MTEDILPVCWILTNTKDFQCYKYCLIHFKELVTRSNRLRWSLEYATVDFEEGLMKAISSVFPEVRLIGCLFHFKQAIWRTASNMGLKSETSIKDPKTGNKSTKMEITSKLSMNYSGILGIRKKQKKNPKKGFKN